MSCNKPLIAFQADEPNSAGKCAISFSPDGGSHPVALPCGQCMGCRLDKARSWAMRLHVEGLEHAQSCFLTLTYDEVNIPYANSLLPDDLQRFIKRLRKHLGSTRIRFYGVGEYGGKFDRPHYHVLLFGFNFPDRRVYLDRGDYTVDNSRTLSALWPFGHATVQNNSFEAGAYCAKYSVKKITGEKAPEHYTWIDEDTGEVFTRYPEFSRMSRRPGIGAAWLEKYYSDLFPKGYVTNGKGVKIPPPEYFNKLYEKWFPEAMAALKDERREDVFTRYMEANIERMEAREAIQKRKVNLRGGK